jgi:NADH-quinone oxidoreductase subunit N
MLFGMSYIFGLTGSTYLIEIVPALQNLGSQPAVLFAVIMVLAGFFYKLAVFPMHFWVPDIYQGAANETTGFIATVPKLGAVAMLIRFMTLPGGENSQILIGLFMVLALASMFYGNLSALVQKDVKRMLGFSGISHAGFIVLGLLTMQVTGYATAIYYIFGYVLMNLVVFLVISNVSQQGENLAIEDLNGLHKREPALAFFLTVGLFALAGIPPFVGFMGKFMLLAGVFKQGYVEGVINTTYLWVVILAAINTGIAIFYYLSVVRAAYTTDPGERPDVAIDWLTKATGVLLVLLIILMGALPSRIIDFAGVAVKGIM